MVFCLGLRTRFAPGTLFLVQLKNRLTYGPRCLCNLIRRVSTLFAAAEIQRRDRLDRSLSYACLCRVLQLITAKMSRFAFALSVLAHVAAQETRITDPSTAAIAQRAQLYELMKAEYTDEGCEAAGWAHRREQHRGGPVPRQTR